MYYRIYPSRNNTVFRYVDNNTILNTFPSDINPNIGIPKINWSLTTNTGIDPVMELQDGGGESVLMYGFELPDWLRRKLQMHLFNCNLKLWDAGTLFQPAIKLKNLKLRYFTDPFVEGDGYSFIQNEAKQGVSNYLYRDSINKWVDANFSDVTTYHLNSINEDLLFDVTNSISTVAVTSDLNPNFALSIDNRETDVSKIYTKFIHSKYTSTVFRPYLEFFINDTIKDSVYSCYANEPNKVYLLNERNIDFVGNVVATMLDNSGNQTLPVVIKPSQGVYYVEVTPPMPISFKDEYLTITWNINNVDLFKQNIKVLNPNKDNFNFDAKNLFFYPITPSSHQIIRQGDVVPFEVISQIRGTGNVINNTYEYRVLSMGEFEMVPWTPVSLYREKMFFMLDTSYFYPEQNYEIFVRNNGINFSLTSHLTYKFKLKQNTESNLRNLTMSPYYSRDYFFAK